MIVRNIGYHFKSIYSFQLPVQIESAFIFGVNLFDFNTVMSKIEKDRGLDHFGMTLILVD